MPPHGGPVGAVPTDDARCCGAEILRAGSKRRDPRTHPGMVFPPVAVPATPELVEPALRDVRAELRLVVNNGHCREVAHVPAGTPEPQTEVDLLEIEEEVLVEEPDLVERLAPEEERSPQHPIDRPRPCALRLG